MPQNNISSSSLACAIEVPDSDNIVLTGGVGASASDSGTVSLVVMYSTEGEVTLLPSLRQRRWGHGCGYYYHNDQLVS